MQIITETIIDAVYSFTDNDQHFATLTFAREPSEAAAMKRMLNVLDPDQLRSLVKISICQLDEGDPLPWLTAGKYHFQR